MNERRKHSHDRMTHLLLSEKLGGRTPPDLSARILGATRRPAPVPAVGASYWRVAAVLLLSLAVVGVLGALAYNLHGKDGTRAGDPARHEIAGPPEQPELPPVHRDEPQELPPTPDPVPTPEDPEEPAQPEVPAPEPSLPPQPEPEPQPPQPAPTTERPPQAEVEEPTDPAPTLERPPSEPPQTPQTPDAPVALGAKVGQVADGARLAWRASATERWQDVPAGMQLSAGMSLRTRRPAEVRFDDGAQVFFDGEITLGGTVAATVIELESAAVYVDAARSARALDVRRGELVVTCSAAEAVVERQGLRLGVTCLLGEVTAGGEVLAAGSTAVLSERGLGRARELGERVRAHALVDYSDRVLRLVRVAAGDAERVYMGRVEARAEGAVAVGEGKEAFGITLPEPVYVRPGAYVRMRVRITGSQGVSWGSKADERDGGAYFQGHRNYIRNGAWIEITAPLEDLVNESKTKGGPLKPGVTLTTFQVILWDDNAKVEVDWIEFGINPDGEE